MKASLLYKTLRAAQAILCAGLLFHVGTMPAEAATAKDYLRMAQRGDVSAMTKVGKMLCEGSGGAPKDLGAGLKWLKKASDSGDLKATMNLGDLYCTGAYGVHKSHQKACQYYVKACRGGVDKAREHAERLDREYLNKFIDEVGVAESDKQDMVAALKSDDSAAIGKLIKKCPKLATEPLTPDKETALQLCKSIKTCQLLFQAGADINKHPVCLFNVGSCYKEKSDDVFNFLLDNGLNVSHPESGKHVLAAAIYSKVSEATVKRILQMGAPVNTYSEFNRGSISLTPIAAACTHKDIAVLRMLIEHGADVNKTYGKLMSPLLLAVNNRWEEAVPLLVNAGANVNDVSPKNASGENSTALKSAVRSGISLATVQFLVEHGANVRWRDMAGQAASHYATNPDVKKYLFEKEIDAVTPRNEIETVIIGVIRSKKNLDAPQEKLHGATCLQAAAIFGEAEFCDLLLRVGADPNATSPTSNEPPLYWACTLQHADCVRLLCNAGANVNWHENDDTTILYYAASAPLMNSLKSEPDPNVRVEKTSEILSILIAAGANVNTTSRGATPLIAAAFLGDHKSVIVLLRAGADPYVQNYKGERAVDVATGQCKKILLQVMRRR